MKLKKDRLLVSSVMWARIRPNVQLWNEDRKPFSCLKSEDEY